MLIILPRALRFHLSGFHVPIVFDDEKLILITGTSVDNQNTALDPKIAAQQNIAASQIHPLGIVLVADCAWGIALKALD